jgi:hypothetical protein
MDWVGVTKKTSGVVRLRPGGACGVASVRSLVGFVRTDTKVQPDTPDDAQDYGTALADQPPGSVENGSRDCLTIPFQKIKKLL